MILMPATARARIFSLMRSDPRTRERATDAQPSEDLARASHSRRKADRALPMSERLARVHKLSKQMSAVKGSARRR
ncbi:MAG: hypothetical protein ACRDL3_05780 [Solirubrobacterales bacterium]